MGNSIIERAEKKLRRIIEREGTAGGARLQPEYLAALIAEAAREAHAETILTEVATA